MGTQNYTVELRKPGRPSKKGGAQRKYTCHRPVYERLQQYFSDRDEKGVPTTIMGLARALDLHPETLIEYEKRRDTDEDRRISDCIKSARHRIIDRVERQLLGGKNLVGAIFWLKNNAGYTDQQRVVHDGAINNVIRVELPLKKPVASAIEVKPKAQLLDK
jgi:hypothetical protein